MKLAVPPIGPLFHAVALVSRVSSHAPLADHHALLTYKIIITRVILRIPQALVLERQWAVL